MPQALGAGFALLRHQCAHRFRRGTRIYKAAAKPRFWENCRIRLDQRAIAHHRAIENDDIILDHAIVTHRAGMHDRVAPCRDAIADNRRKVILRDMDGACLSNEEIVPDADEMAVSPDRRAARYHGVRARLDLAEHAGVRPKEAHALAETRLDAIERQDKR